MAGSAVGVVSLGLTVCQGLVEYYTAYQGQDEELDQAIEKVFRIASLLEVLQPRLESHRAPFPVAVSQAEDCIIACSEPIHALQEFLQKYRQDNASENIPEKLRTFGRKALFPFRRGTLQSLRKMLAECQTNLGTAISILQM